MRRPLLASIALALVLALPTLATASALGVGQAGFLLFVVPFAIISSLPYIVADVRRAAREEPSRVRTPRA